MGTALIVVVLVLAVAAWLTSLWFMEKRWAGKGR